MPDAHCQLPAAYLFACCPIFFSNGNFSVLKQEHKYTQTSGIKIAAFLP